MKTLLLLTIVALSQVARAESPKDAPPEEKVFECTGEMTTGKGAFRAMVVVAGDTAKVADVTMKLTADNSPDYFNYVANLGGRVYQLTLFRKTGRFKYSTYIKRLQVAEGDCKKVERSNVFE